MAVTVTGKDTVLVMIISQHFVIEGRLHILSGSRLTDALNSKAKDFLALTEAKVRLASDESTLYETPYLAVNRSSIHCIFPLGEPVPVPPVS